MSQPVITPVNKFVLPGDDSHNTPWGPAIQLLQAAFLLLDSLVGSILGIQQSAYTYGADTGVANAYAVALSPAPTLVAGSAVIFKAVHANTAASTLAVNGGSAIAIHKNGTTALAGAEISAGQMVHVIYDGSSWQLISI